MVEDNGIMNQGQHRIGSCRPCIGSPLKALLTVGVVGIALGCMGCDRRRSGLETDADGDVSGDANGDVTGDVDSDGLGHRDSDILGDSEFDGDGDSDEDRSRESDTDLPDYSDSPCYGLVENTRVFDFLREDFVDVETTCRAEGAVTMVYVQNELWDQGAITQSRVNAFMHRFELIGPENAYDPHQGVIMTNQEIFGDLLLNEFPNDKLHVFIIDSDGYSDGYVCPAADGWCDYYCLHLDGVLLDFDGDEAISVASHESFHIIHYFIDGTEDWWLDESLAEAAMIINGYYTDQGWVDDFLRDTDDNWGPALDDARYANYGAFLLWGAFLWELGGPELMRAITSEQADGWVGLNMALADLGFEVSAEELFLDFVVALGVADPDLGYGYSFAEIAPVRMSSTTLGAGDSHSDSVEPYGIDYYPIEGEGSVTFELTADSTVTLLGVVVGDTVDVENLTDGGSLDMVGVDTAFVAVTATSSAEYTIDVQ